MMFDTIKRWMGTAKPESVSAGPQVLTDWAKSEGHTIKTVSGHAHGVVVETRAGWRVEWGHTQRPYFQHHELRFRCDCGVSPDVQMLFLSKAMAQALESDVFQRFTDAMQTRIDNTLPDEMRWLALHSKVSLAEHPVLARRFLLLSNAESVTRQWLAPDLLTALEAAASSWWTDGLIVLMTVNRGILTIRMSGDDLEPNQLKLVGRLFDLAAARLTALS